MQAEYAIRNAVLADPAARAGCGGQYWPLRFPQGAQPPAITYHRLSMPRAARTQSNGGPQDPKILLNCWADGYDAAEALGDLVITALDRGHDAVAGMSLLLVDDQPFEDPETGLYARRLFWQVYMENA